MRGSVIFCLVIAGSMLFAGVAFCLIDVNSASQSELESLPGVGPKTAQKIIEGRPYSSVSDLTRVKGIGNKTLGKFRDMITCGAPEKKGKKKSASAAPAAGPIEVPVYSIESLQLIKCWNCSNISQVSSELKSGWCPYCNAKWAVK